MSSFRAYHTLCELGKGSYGAVTKNRHILTGDIVAIKCFTAEKKDFTNIKRNVMVEVSALRELVNHENVIKLYHVFVENYNIYLVFEFVERTLLDVIRSAPKKMLGPGRRSKSLAYQLLRAIAFVHSCNYIHRDVKPENILVNSDGSLKLADFGFSVKTSHNGGQRLPTYIATRWYRAPELLTGDNFYGTPVDVWAAGAVIVEMILGQPMAAGADEVDQLAKTIALVGQIPTYMMERIRFVPQNHPYQNNRFEGLNLLLKDVPTSFSNLIKLCLEPDPNLRTTSDALLRQNIFTREDPHFISDILTEVRQSSASTGRNAAAAYRDFLKKKDLYYGAAKEMMLYPKFIGSTTFSKYRQMGLSDRVVRGMAEMINREGKLPPDFVFQDPDLNHCSRGRGDASNIQTSSESPSRLWSSRFRTAFQNPSPSKSSSSSFQPANRHTLPKLSVNLSSMSAWNPSSTQKNPVYPSASNVSGQTPATSLLHKMESLSVNTDGAADNVGNRSVLYGSSGFVHLPQLNTNMYEYDSGDQVSFVSSFANGNALKSGSGASDPAAVHDFGSSGHSAKMSLSDKMQRNKGQSRF